MDEQSNVSSTPPVPPAPPRTNLNPPITTTPPMRNFEGMPPSGAVEVRQPSKLPRILLIVFLICLFLGGGAYAAYYYKVWPFTSASAEKMLALDLALDRLLEMTSASYEAEIALSAGPRQPGVSGLDTLFLSDERSNTDINKAFQQVGTGLQDQIFQSIPEGFNLSLMFSGRGDVQTTADSDVELVMAGEFSDSSMSLAVDFEYRKVDEKLYVRLNSFPTQVLALMPGNKIDLDAIIGEWIEVSEESIAAYSGATFDAAKSLASFSNYDSAQSIELSRQVFDIAQEEGVFTIDYNIEDSNLRGTEHYVYGVAINKDALLPHVLRVWPVYRKFIMESSSTSVDLSEAIPEGLISFFQSEQFDLIMDYFSANTEIRIGVDKESGYLDYYSFKLSIAPSVDSETSDIQLNLSFTGSYDDINVPVNIIAPDEVISIQDMMMAVSGMTDEEFKFTTQIENIRKIRSGLHSFKVTTGSYPSKLEDLLIPMDEAPIDTNPIYAGLVLSNMPFIGSIPIDVYLENSFEYLKTEKDYELRYRVDVPINSEIISVRELLKIYDGENTATSDNLSKEGNENLLADDDFDGLPNLVEDYFGSRNDAADSDNDGFNDGDEVRNGYSPVGAAKLDYKDHWFAIDPRPPYPLEIPATVEPIP